MRLRPGRPTREPLWRVRARVTAPGDFPEQSFAGWTGRAKDAHDARAKARAYFEASWVPPITIFDVCLLGEDASS